jgi:hypothetical protein
MKRLALPILILVVLLLVYFLVQARKEKAVAPERTTGYVQFNAEKVDSIIITKPQESLKFAYLDGGWKIYIDSLLRQANQQMVDEIVKMISDIQVGGVESENPDRQDLYQVDTASGSLIQAYVGDTLAASFILGKNAQGYNYSYIRKTGSNQVYRAKDVTSYSFDKPAKNWRDKTIASVDTSMLSTVIFQYPDEKFSLERQDSLWFVMGDKITGSAPAVRDSIELLKRLLVDLKADDFYQPADTEFAAAGKPELVLKLKYTNGKEDELTLMGGNDAKTRYYIEASGQNEPFVILYAKYSGLTRKSNNFISAEKKG